MAVAYDAISESLTNGDANPSWTHTPSGTPSAVVVFIAKSRPQNVTGVTYGGVAMTLLGEEVFGTSQSKLQIWGLATSVPSGAQTVAITASGSAFAQHSYAVTFTGTQTTTAAAFSGFTSTETLTGAGFDTLNLTASSASGDLVADSVLFSTFPGTDRALAPGGSQTERAESYDGDENNYAMSTAPGAASVSLSYVCGGGGTGIAFGLYAAVNIVQAAAAGAPFVPRRLSLNQAVKRAAFY